MYELINATLINRESLKAAVDERKEIRKSGNKDHEALKKQSFNAIEGVLSISDPRAQKEVINVLRKAVNSYDIQGRRITSYFDEMFELANTETVFLNVVEANGIGETTDYSVSWREESPNDAAVPAFFNANIELPPQAQATEAIRSNTAGTYGNTILVPWVTRELGEQSKLGAYDVLANQMRKQMMRMKKFRDQKFLVNTEVVSELIGDTPQWAGFYTDSVLNQSAIAGGGNQDETEATLNAIHYAIGNPASLDALGIHTALIALTTPQQLDTVRHIERDKYNAETSAAYLANQARIAKNFPGANLDPDQVVFFKPRLGAAIAFVHDPFFTAVAPNTTFVFDPNRPRIVKFRMMGQYGPWVVKREIPELVDEFAVFDFESIINPNRETRGSHTNTN